MDNTSLAPHDMQHKILMACRHLETTDFTTSLAELAQTVSLSPSHFQRKFTEWVGLSPKRYAMARRDERVRTLLSEGQSIAQAFLNAGYETPSRFYEGIASKLGMKPSQYRAKGSGVPVRVSMGVCSLGEFLVGLSSKGVCAIELGEDANALLHAFQARFTNAQITPAQPCDDALVAQVIEVLEGSSIAKELPLDIQGTVFQCLVWQALTQIPHGKTASYTEIAHAIGRPAAHRAVARACAGNALAVAIPCHRVVKSDGALSGYRWGVERKQQLLDRERQSI